MSNRRFSPEYLEQAARNPAISALKERSYEDMINSKSGTYLDIGCGPGIDALMVAKRLSETATVIGVDSDETQLRMATTRAATSQHTGRLEYIRGEATALPLRDHLFDGCRCERVLQHLSPSDGILAFREAVRVTKPGGKLIFIDTDWPSLSIHSGDFRTERLLASLHLRSIRNPYAARGLADLFRLGGVSEISQKSEFVPLTAYAVGMLLGGVAQNASRLGLLSLEAYYGWYNSLVKSEDAKSFFAGVNMVTCSARVEYGNA